MTFAWDYTSCHAAISTLLMILANNVQKLCKKSGFKSYLPVVGAIETQVSCTTAETEYQGAHACGNSTSSTIEFVLLNTCFAVEMTLVLHVYIFSEN